MRVTIVDVEWYNKYSFVPNVLCMKLSSYHKQRGDIVNFAENNYHLRLDFDTMYVVREGPAGSLPAGIPLCDPRVYLIGKGFRFYERYMKEIPEVISACRPDYLLYRMDEDNKMTRANIIQFYSNGKRLPLIQDYHNAIKKAKWNLVVDENFWSQSVEDIEACVEFLKKDKNIVFQKEIQLKSIINNEKIEELFMSLDYKRGSSFKFVCEEEDLEKAISFMKRFRDKFSNLKLLPVYVSLKYRFNHNSEPDKIINDLVHWLSLIDKAKENGVAVVLQAPSRRESPLWFYFEELEAWMTYAPKESMIEWFCGSAQTYHKASFTAVFYNKLKWSTPQIQWLMDIARKYPDVIKKYGYRRWEEEFFPTVDFGKVLKEWRCQ